ncbi:glycosyltransferase family 39 protein [Nonomuraea antimicrobica]|uniref:glycosyltransferase family 39 protein n=1 Tax=Nonomuraea antimicrobica TaxID=561173 RepID=UPI0031ED4FF2
MAWRPVAAVGGSLTALLLALSGRYGYDADELYFRVAGQHLDWGYVDQPPLVPLLARLQIALFGDTVIAIRVIPALLAGLTVLLAALVARELGGARRAQVLAAVATAVSMFPTAVGHMLHTATVDIPVWVAMSWLVIRILRTGEPRLWLVAGLVGGVGLLAKNLVVLLAIGLVGGILLAGPRRVLRGPHLWAGIGCAALVASPALVWQAAHGWPQLEMAQQIGAIGSTATRVMFLPFQVILIGPLVTPLWVAGLLALFRWPRWRRYRALGVGFLIVAALVVLSAGKVHYAMGCLVTLVAAGCVPAARWTSGVLRRVALVAALAGNGVYTAVAGLPIIPESWLARYPVLGIAQITTKQIGWPELAGQVGAVYRSLPPGERERAVLFGGTYAEAGALARYGPENALPPVYSGHNSLHAFARPADDKTVVIAVNVQPGFTELFDRCEERGRFGLQNEPVLVCHDPKERWSRLWPQLRHISA